MTKHELKEAVERLKVLATDLDYAALPTKPDVVTLCGGSAANVRDDLRTILSALPQGDELERLREALERIADPRNIHFAGDAQVVARAALFPSDQSDRREG